MRFGHTSTRVDSLEQLLKERDAMLDEIQFNLIKGQQAMKFYADLKRREIRGLGFSQNSTIAAEIFGKTI